VREGALERIEREDRDVWDTARVVDEVHVREVVAVTASREAASCAANGHNSEASCPFVVIIIRRRVALRWTAGSRDTMRSATSRNPAGTLSSIGRRMEIECTTAGALGHPQLPGLSPPGAS